MFIRKWSPVYDREDEAGSSDVDLEQDDVQTDDQFVDEKAEQRKDIRSQLESSFKKANEAADKEEKKAAKEAKGREGRAGTAMKSRARQELEEAEKDDANLDVEEPEAEDKTAAASQAPASLPKEAKAEWAKTPKAIQAAWTKRDQDIEKGVKQLKQNYADIDAVLAPRSESLKQMGKSPAEAVNQLFSWFDALNMDPVRVKNGQPPVALLALANSLGLDLSPLFQQQQQQQQQEPAKAKEAAAEDDIPPALKNYIGQLEAKIEALGGNVQQGFQTFQQTFAQQAQEQTNKILETWSNGKPYFDEVRIDMANILKSGMVQPLADGSADLDKAYEMALYANPDVREKVLVDRRKAALEKKRKAEEAELKAQQAAANKARRASAGLGPSAPGITVAGEKKAPGRKSVRESIADAMEELGS